MAYLTQMTDQERTVKTKRKILVIGWMEYVHLPDLGLLNIKAKIDTGARTSALHATNIETFKKGEEVCVRFTTRASQDGADISVESPIYSMRSIKNTSGVPQERIVIRTKFRLAQRLWMIDLSLANRENMTFGLIVGRTALKNHSIAVHTHRALLTQKRPD